MQSGKLRHRITIHDQSESQDSLGQVVVTPAAAFERWAAIEPLSGRELINAQALQADVTHSVTIRHTPGVGPRMQIQFGSRTFNIGSVLNVDERNREMRLGCVEVVR
jgi:SPP1 family predicted phage head-tail adaptor